MTANPYYCKNYSFWHYTDHFNIFFHYSKWLLRERQFFNLTFASHLASDFCSFRLERVYTFTLQMTVKNSFLRHFFLFLIFFFIRTHARKSHILLDPPLKYRFYCFPKCVCWWNAIFLLIIYAIKLSSFLSPKDKNNKKKKKKKVYKPWRLFSSLTLWKI